MCAVRPIPSFDDFGDHLSIWPGRGVPHRCARRVPCSYGNPCCALRPAAQEMDLLLEEEFLDVLVSLGRSLPWHDIWQQPLPRARSPAGAQQSPPPPEPPSAVEQSQQELQVRDAAVPFSNQCQRRSGWAGAKCLPALAARK